MTNNKEVVQAENVKVKEAATVEAPQTIEFKTIDELADHLIAQGVSPVVAVMTAKEQFEKAGQVQRVETMLFGTEEQVKEIVEKETPVAPQPEVVEQPKVEAPVKEEPKKEKPMKAWFKRASEKLSFSNKTVLVANLYTEKRNAETEAEKAEIQKFIDRLQNDEGFYKSKVEPVVAKLKGWSIDASGKVADALYVTGDYAGKGASGLTKVVGKTTKMVGEGIVKTGEFVEDHAQDVGKLVEAPFKLAGDAINVVNGTKKVEKKK